MTYFIFQTGIQSKNGSANLEIQELISKPDSKLFMNKKRRPGPPSLNVLLNTRYRSYRRFP